MPETLLILATLGEVGFNSPLPLSVLSVIVGLGRKACWTTPLVLWTFLHFCVQILLSEAQVLGVSSGFKKDLVPEGT